MIITCIGGLSRAIPGPYNNVPPPPIIFPNEPTASLYIIGQCRMVVIISHSLAQVVDSDCIYVMKKGHMVESGTHDELYDMKGTYREIFDASGRSLNIEMLAKTMADDGGRRVGYGFVRKFHLSEISVPFAQDLSWLFNMK